MRRGVEPAQLTCFGVLPPTDRARHPECPYGLGSTNLPDRLFIAQLSTPVLATGSNEGWICSRKVSTKPPAAYISILWIHTRAQTRPQLGYCRPPCIHGDVHQAGIPTLWQSPAVIDRLLHLTRPLSVIRIPLIRLQIQFVTTRRVLDPLVLFQCRHPRLPPASNLRIRPAAVRF